MKSSLIDQQLPFFIPESLGEFNAVEDAASLARKMLRSASAVTTMSPGAAKALASLAEELGDVYELGKKRPSHVWEKTTGKSFCGLKPPKGGQRRLLGTAIDFEADKVCLKCKASLRRRLRRNHEPSC
jgi:hypothetical protein